MELTNGEAKTLQPIPLDPRDDQIARLDKKIEMMQKELQQYRNDLVFWHRAHGADYPVRRLQELSSLLEEIGKL